MGAKEDAEAWRQLVANDPAMAPPKPTAGESAARGALQGVTSGWGDEAAARIEQGASKIPGLRNVAQMMQPEGAPPITDPNVTYEQRRDFKRDQNAAAQKENPLAYGAGNMAGSVAQAAIPGVGALGRGANIATRLGGAALSGANSGAGLSDAKDIGGVAKDAGGGAIGGTLGGLAGEGVRGLAKGAAARVEDRAFKGLGEDVRQPLKTALGDQSVRVRDVLKEPAIRGALGNPGKMLEATSAGMAETGNAARPIMQAADKAAGGGMRVKDVTAPLLSLQSEMAKNSEHPAAVAALKRVIGQFESGLGSDPSQMVPTEKVREFLTNQLQKPGFARGLHADPPPAQAALRRAAGVVKDSIESHVTMALDPKAAAALQALNDRTTAYAVIQGAAQEQVSRGAQAPGVMSRLGDLAKHHGIVAGAPAAVGALVGGIPGAIVGGAAGEAASRAAPVIDQALATKSGQWAARAAPRATRSLSPAIQSAITAGDHRKAVEMMGQEVFGE